MGKYYVGTSGDVTAQLSQRKPTDKGSGYAQWNLLAREKQL